MLKINDRVIVAMKSRGWGPGGWETHLVSGKVHRVGRINIQVELDEYFHGFIHWMKPERLQIARPIEKRPRKH